MPPRREPTTHLKQLGERIKARREELHMSQRELADQIPGKADSSQLSKWERGVNRPSDNTLEHIAAVLGCTMADLLTGDLKTAPASPLGGMAAIETRLGEMDEKLDRLVEWADSADTQAMLQRFKDLIAGETAVGEHGGGETRLPG